MIFEQTMVSIRDAKLEVCMNTRSFVLAVLIAGVTIGLLANLPVLNLINCALCVWVWFGGALAVLLYRWFEHGEVPVGAGQGAGLGAVSGIIGALFGSVVFLLTSPISIPLFNGLARSLGVQGEMPFRSSSIGEVVATAFVFLVLDAVLYPVFGALGAVIAASLTRGRRAEVGGTVSDNP